MKRVTTEVSVWLHDTHIPYHDRGAVAAAVELIGYLQPKHIFLNGDIIDFYPISRYEKDPARKLTLQADIDQTKSFFASLRAASPDASIIYLPGNHEDRLRKYLLSRAEELSGLEDLKFENLLRLAEYGISLVPRNKVLLHHDIVITHGDRVQKKSGLTAHAMIDKYGTSGHSGHTHRAAKVSRTLLTGTKTWIEGGCLCQLNPEYVDGVADWQQALTVGYTMDGHTEMDLIFVRDGRLYFDGHIFGGDHGERGTA